MERGTIGRRALGAALAAVLCGRLAADDVMWGPVLQCLRAGSVWITWETAEEVVGVVRCAPRGGDRFEAAEEAPSRRHGVRLGGLMPDTAYQYETVPHGGAGVLRGSFRTPPAAPGGEVEFLVASDTGLSPDQDPESRERILEAIRVLRPAFVLHAGDFTHESNFEEGYFRPWAGVLGETMVYTATGNHEIMDGGYRAYVERMITRDEGAGGREELYYSFDWGPVHVVVVDSVSFEAIPELLAEQEDFVREDFRLHAEVPWRVLLTHCPPYTRTSMHAAHVATLERYLTGLCDENAIDVVFCGHVHSYQRSLPVRGGDTGPLPHGRGLFVDPLAPVYVVTGGGREAYGFDRPGPARWFAAGAECFSFLLVSAAGRTLTVEALRLGDGALLDGFTIEKSPPAPDTEPPVISGVRVERCGEERALVVWETDERTAGEVVCYYEGGDPVRTYRSSYFMRRHGREVAFTFRHAEARFALRVRDASGNERVSEGHLFPQEVAFVRGDANLDGRVNVGDALAIAYLAVGGAVGGLPCAAAGDLNADGGLDLADALRLLDFLFAAGPPPPAPFPEAEALDEGSALPCAGGLYTRPPGLDWW